LSLITVYAITLGILLGLVTILWLASLRLGNSSIIDIFWGAGFVIANGVYFVLTPDGFLARKWLIGALVTVWGLRLSLHILLRNWGKPEDFRYQTWRRQAGSAWAWQSFYRVFLLQGMLMWVISATLLASQSGGQPAHLTVFDFLGAVICLVGFFFEAVGDAQLARFKANPAQHGQILDGGVWRYTRHPNYFGDAAQWWGFFLIAAAAGGGWTIFSPILMTLLLLRVSGVALLEKTLETRPGYQEYIQKTSAFIPWFPRDL
jgi:steroid 5-alpha reductase family enzyme